MNREKEWTSEGEQKGQTPEYVRRRRPSVIKGPRINDFQAYA